MKFLDVFPTFKFYKEWNELDIQMDDKVADGLSDEDAIKFSIMKFEKILKVAKKLSNGSSFYPRLGTGTCPLCQKYLVEAYMEDCVGCPIYEKTGQQHCDDTPYVEIANANDTSEYIPALEHEIEFLKGLLK